MKLKVIDINLKILAVTLDNKQNNCNQHLYKRLKGRRMKHLRLKRMVEKRKLLSREVEMRVPPAQVNRKGPPIL